MHRFEYLWGSWNQSLEDNQEQPLGSEKLNFLFFFGLGDLTLIVFSLRNRILRGKNLLKRGEC